MDEIGLDANDRRMLNAMIRYYNGGPVGLETLAAAIGEEAVTIEDVYEPYLMQIGFLNRTPRGRCVTRAAYLHLGLTPPGGADPAAELLRFGQGAGTEGQRLKRFTGREINPFLRCRPFEGPWVEKTIAGRPILPAS